MYVPDYYPNPEPEKPKRQAPPSEPRGKWNFRLPDWTRSHGARDDSIPEEKVQQFTSDDEYHKVLMARILDQGGKLRQSQLSGPDMAPPSIDLPPAQSPDASQLPPDVPPVEGQ